MKHIKAEDLIVYENSTMIAINKPSGITSETDNQEGVQSIADIVKRRYPEAMLCHRLDKETSGLLLAAKDPETYRYISMLFQKRKISKEYHALVAGIHHAEGMEIKLPIEKRGTKKAVVDRKYGKMAVTVIDALENFKHYTLLKARPLTGRFHQIRVHLSASGMPITGDKQYGGKDFYLSEVKRAYHTGKYEEEKPVMSRTALHAFRLSFETPEGKLLELEAPYPKDLDTALKLLRRYDQP